MAWLEALAAKHGAKPEELVTDPNARTEQAPEWVDKAKEIGEQAPEVPQPPPDATGIWLRNLAAEEEIKAGATAEMEPTPEPSEEEAPVDVFSSLVEQEQLTMTTSEPAEERPSAAPTDAAQEEEAGLPRYDDLPAWLSGLTPKPVQPHTMDDAPAWLRNPSMVESDESEPQAQAEPEMEAPEAAPTPQAPRAEESPTDLPAWLAGLDEEEKPSAAAAAAQPADELPAWLQVEVEPEPEAKEPAKPSDWHPVQPLEVKPAEPPAPPPPPVEAEPTRAAEPKPEPVVEAKPAPAPELQPAPVVEAEIPPPPVAEVEPERVVEEPAPPPAPPEPAPRPVEKAPSPAPARPRPAAAPAKAAALSLVDAQSQLGSGNISAALDIYGKLIRKGKSLEDIIHDLRDALYRYPVEVPLWQSLGDAYMRANRLQEALDAYTKAEELLR